MIKFYNMLQSIASLTLWFLAAVIAVGTIAILTCSPYFLGVFVVSTGLYLIHLELNKVSNHD
jgi:hypothetical protein